LINLKNRVLLVIQFLDLEDNNQYTNTKVQPKDFTSGWMIAFIIAGSALSISFLYLGSEIALNLGFKKSLLAFGISTLVLTALCAVTTLYVP